MIPRLFGARLSNVLQWSRTSTSSAFNIHTQSLNSAGKLLPTWSPVQSTLFCLRPPVILHSNYNNTFRQTIRGFVSQQNNSEAKRVKSFATYVLACFIFMLGGAYAGVPLYRMICQSTGYGGEVKKGHDTSKLETMKPVNNRVIRVRFNADTASSMQWNFKPQQTEIKLVPGETALAFYRAKNPTDVPIVGISTYNVIPFEAGQYFNKIQCFCFEEQRLNPHEEVDMPVFFFIDPEYCDDPKMEKIDVITLSYTFFEAKEGVNLTVPNYYRPHQQ